MRTERENRRVDDDDPNFDPRLMAQGANVGHILAGLGGGADHLAILAYVDDGVCVDNVGSPRQANSCHLLSNPFRGFLSSILSGTAGSQDRANQPDQRP